MGKLKSTEPTTEIGDRFENQVAAAMRLIPGTSVQQRIRVKGKVVDLLLTVRGRFGSADELVAVECKDYSRRLNRSQVAEILKDYYPLLQNSGVNAVVIVTRNGVLENARDCLDGKLTRHLTYSEVLRLVLDLSPLAHEMSQQYFTDRLNEYYEPLQLLAPDYDLVREKYKWYVNPFMDFAMSSPDMVSRLHRLSLDMIKTQWYKHLHRLEKWEFAGFADDYDEDLFSRVTRDFVQRKAEDLDSYVARWLKDDTAKFHLAILGSYGTGKTTYARHLAHRCATEYEQGLTDRVPLLIELRHFSADQDIQGLVTNELANRHCVEGATFTRFQSLNRQGAFVLILDGLDEMKYGMSKEAVTHNLSEINSLAVGASKILICGRPTLFSDTLEEYALLQGLPDTSLTNHVQYLPLNIAPIPYSRLYAVAEAYTKVQDTDDPDRQAQYMGELKRGLRYRPSLRELLARPVHIHMLLKVLPTLPEGSIAALQRGDLYLRFIRMTIARDVIKRRKAGSPVTEPERFDFAARLACEMAIQGDIRTISMSAIPDKLFERYRYPGRSLELTKADMRSACFLEMKPPDMLYFGHKSYCEFLIAHRLLSAIRHGEATLHLTGIISYEVASFLLGSATTEDFIRAARDFPIHRSVVDKLFEGKGEIKVDSIQKRKLADAILEYGSSHLLNEEIELGLAHTFIDVCRQFKHVAGRSSQACRALNALIRYPDTSVASSAFALLPRRLRPSREYLRKVLTSEEYSAWGKDPPTDFGAYTGQ